MKVLPLLTQAFKLTSSTLAGIQRINEIEIRVQLLEKMNKLHSAISLAHDAVLALQDKNTALANENEQLRKDKAAWQKHTYEAKNYSLRQLAPDVCVYIHNDAGDDLTYIQKYCQPCFDKGIKSGFNFEKNNFKMDTLGCPACGLRIRLPQAIDRQHMDVDII